MDDFQMVTNYGFTPPSIFNSIIEQIHPDIIAQSHQSNFVSFPAKLEGCVVLDVGCGIGRNVFILSKLVGSTGQVIGIDLHKEQLDNARQYIDYHMKQFNLIEPNVSFMEGDIQNLIDTRLDASSFDVVVCTSTSCDIVNSFAFIVNHKRTMKTITESVFRVLKCGGEFIFSDVCSNREIPEQNGKLLTAEDVGGVLRWKDVVVNAIKVGFTEPRLMMAHHTMVDNTDIEKLIGHAKLISFICRCFKLPSNKIDSEPTTSITSLHQLTYQTPLLYHEEEFFFDNALTFKQLGELQIIDDPSIVFILSNSRYRENFSFHPIDQKELDLTTTDVVADDLSSRLTVNAEDVRDVIRTMRNLLNSASAPSSDSSSMDSVINRITFKWPRLCSMQDDDLILFNDEPLELQKQHFYESVVYLLFSRHWAVVKSAEASNATRFSSLYDFLGVIEKYVLDIVISASSMESPKYSYVISVTPVLLQEKPTTLDCREVIHYELCMVQDFQTVNTASSYAFHEFFELIRKVVSLDWVLCAYVDLLKNDDTIVDAEELRIELHKSISRIETSLCLARLPAAYTALTLFDGSILFNINGPLGLLPTMRDRTFTLEHTMFSTSLITWAMFMITLLHELSHSIRRTQVRRAHNLFQSQTSPKRQSQTSKSKRQKQDLGEVADFIEWRLFGGRESTMGDADARWILDINNWTNDNAKDGEWFGKKLQENIITDKKRNGSSRNRLNFASHSTTVSDDEEHYPNRLDMGKCGVPHMSMNLNSCRSSFT